jgi:nitrogenase molybdenum-iron protein NifN
MSDVEKEMEDGDILISNFHGERICQKLHKTLILRGFPNYETVGNQLKYDLLYEGSAQFLFEVANKLHH